MDTRGRSYWMVLLGCLGAAGLCWLLWLMATTPSPSLPVQALVMLVVVGLAVGPWAVLVSLRLPEGEARSLHRRGVLVASWTAGVGLWAALVVCRWPTGLSRAVASMSVLAAGAVVLVGAVALPWLFLTTRTLARERAARVRAEHRAEVAAHLHDSVLQALTLIQKRSAQPDVRRLARGTERDLRAWLYGAPPADPDDFATAVSAAAAAVEDRFAVTVEVVAVGTCRLDERTAAVVGAVREALANAARHADVRNVSVFAEVTDSDVFALVRDRGRGFDPAASPGADRRGIRDSIELRVRQHGGTAVIRSAPGEGTEVELRLTGVGA
ncbi:sensor histidine kinase [Saccharothrix obliqua]|uniref:sensor histidine kinase n=1 Tax=Saccharothrix obliqua TaxID=2861747 RepID=UPI001C5DEDB2|nr:ATP-binding protein [Saccharothrix obliqua]MBW4718094.1 ATP-binding protein [Saccharothrix obliqua]